MTVTLLAFDTSAAHVAACVLQGERVLSVKAESMARGQAERLVPMLQDVLTDAGMEWADLMRIGVGIGPGNFTGIRISVACARGLALALDIPAVGVSNFQATRQNTPGACAAVPAARGQMYIEQSDGPALVNADNLDNFTLPPSPDALVAAIARVARDATNLQAPAPLYIKPADASPSRETPPVILDDR